MELLISNKITVKDAEPAVFDWCKKHLEFPNPEYAKKQSMGIWVGNIDPKIVLWERRGGDAILPYGLKYRLQEEVFSWRLPPVKNLLWEKCLECDIDYQSRISLYDYQQSVLDNIKKTNGVIVMPCGAGKTQTALALVAKLGKRTLWLTHTHELLKQSMERAKGCFGLADDQYGTISQGKINVGKAITFATIQTLVNIDLKPYEEYWDVIVVDECHKAVGTPTKLMMFYKVVSSLKAVYKFGLTATPKRSDGLEQCMFALIGKKLVEVAESAVAHNTVPIYVWQYQSTTYNPDMREILRTDGTLNYTELITDMCHNAERNAEIAGLVNQMNASGKTCLVLSDRVEHLELLREQVGKNYTMQIYSMSGTKEAKQARKDCLDKLRTKQIRALFATYQLAKEGLDIPSLDCVVFATPKKDNISVVQSCGRVGRKAPGKTAGYVIDYVDTQLGILKNYGRARRSVYKSKKYNIT